MKNISASVRQKLKNLAKNEGKPFHEILQYYSMERFLYRLSQSPHREKFILKGALMLVIWDVPDRRVTMDIDMLGEKTSNQEESVSQLIKEILLTEVEDDGLAYDLNSIAVTIIKEDAEYSGIRVNFKALLNAARISMQIDIGFGDVIHPEAKQESMHTYLPMPAPVIYCYSKESAIAEKFEAIVKLDLFNSRMKDFYDIWLMSRFFDMELESLSFAIQKTFKNRGTSIPNKPSCFEIDFCEAKQDDWRIFVRKMKLDFVPEELKEVISGIEKFIFPALQPLDRSKLWKSSLGCWV